MKAAHSSDPSTGSSDDPCTKPRLQQFILLAVLIGLALLSSRGLFRAYSYWHDELFTIGAASVDSWADLFKIWIFPDTHPPFHLVLLKAWIGLFGPGEISTRLLSLIPAWLSLIAMALATRGGGFMRQLIAILFLGTTPLFSLYAQEVRPYSWALLFATTAVTTMTLLWRSQRPGLAISLSKLHRLRLGFGLSLLLLSLSHYFGLFYAATLVALDLRSSTPCLGRRRHGLILLVSLSAWPLLHSLFGGGGGRTAWIEPQPVVGVIKAAFSGVFPAFSVALALALMATLAMARGEKKQRPSRLSLLHQELRCDPNAKEALKLLAGAATFLGLICLIDLIKPLSVERYFIVLLPTLALALADGGQALFNIGSSQTRRATAMVLTVTIAMHFGHSQEVLSAKIYPQQNYKQLASFLLATDLCRAASHGVV